MAEDRALADLLDLDGEEIRYPGEEVARFVVRRTAVTAARPHGIDHALTLHGPHGARAARGTGRTGHGPHGKRLMGLDNAHPLRHLGGRLGRASRAHDH